MGRPEGVCLDCILKFVLFYLEIPSDDANNEFFLFLPVGIIDEGPYQEYCLCRLVFLYLEECSKLFDGLAIRGKYLFCFLHFLAVVGFLEGSHLAVCCIMACRTGNDGVLTNG